MKSLTYYKKRSIAKKIVTSCLTYLLLAYFAFHILYGNRGLIAYFELNQKLSEANSHLQALRSERIKLEHQNRLLRTESLDKDMLDQQAREILNVSKEKEELFYRKQNAEDINDAK